MRAQQQTRQNHRIWWRVYKHRMDNGMEHCRKCGRRDGLTFDHIHPRSDQGPLGLDNITILCEDCNQAKQDTVRDWPSLADEESTAAPERQWSKIGMELYGLPVPPSVARRRARHYAREEA